MEEKIKVQVINGDGSLGNRYIIDEAKENTIPTEGIKEKLLAIKVLSEQINREICSSKYSKWSNNNWNSFQIIITAIDTIDDCSDAIINYIDMTTEEYKKFSRLSLYGILQAIYMQQDAIKFLNNRLRIETEISNYYETIREIRNNISGYPISDKTGRKDGIHNFYFLSKGLYDKWYFEYASYTPEFKPNKVELKNLLDEHIVFLSEALIRIQNNLNCLLKDNKTK